MLSNVGSIESGHPVPPIGAFPSAWDGVEQQRNCWDPRTWHDSFHPGRSVSPQFIRRPDDGERDGVYAAVAFAAMNGGNAKAVTDGALLAQLAQAQLQGGRDITSPGTADNDQTMFVIDGRIFVRVVGFAGPAHAQWYEVEPPRFFA